MMAATTTETKCK